MVVGHAVPAFWFGVKNTQEIEVQKLGDLRSANKCLPT